VPRDKTRSIRIDDELWEASQTLAAERGESVTAVIVGALRRYVRSGGWDVSPIDALERLARLHERGAIPDEEYGRARRMLLDRI